MGLVSFSAHLGVDFLKQLRRNLPVPLICANLIAKKETGGRKQETGIHPFEPYKVVKVDGLRVGIIGVISKGEEKGARFTR